MTHKEAIATLEAYLEEATAEYKRQGDLVETIKSALYTLQEASPLRVESAGTIEAGTIEPQVVEMRYAYTELKPIEEQALTALNQLSAENLVAIVSTLQGKLCVSRTAVDVALKSLMKQGLVTRLERQWSGKRPGAYRYYLTEKGKDVARNISRRGMVSEE